MSFLDGDIELGDVTAGQTLAAGGHAARHNETNDALEEIRDVLPTKADQADLDAALVGEGNVPVPSAAGQVLRSTGTSLGDHSWGTPVGAPLAGVLADRPAAAADNVGVLYLASDVNGGTLFRSNGSSWVQVAPGVTEIIPDIPEPPVWVSARRFVANNSGPSLSFVGSGTSRTTAWMFDGSTDERVSETVGLPSGWSTAHVDVYWTVSSSTTGDVKWQFQQLNVEDGTNVDANATGGSATGAVPANSVTAVTRLGGTLTVAPVKKLQIVRLATDGADTATVDAALLGVRLSKAS